MRPTTIALRIGLLLPSMLALTEAAMAASSFTNSLTGFTGNSTQTATQTAVAAAGFNFSATQGSFEDPPGTFLDPTIEFAATGAQFGNLIASDGGRNYMRTNDTDYANVSFVAEVTWITSDIASQASYFGLGSAEFGSFRIADWGTAFSAAQLFQEINLTTPEVFTLKNRNTLVLFDEGTDAPGLDTGTNRLRLTYDWFRKTADFAIDVNYAGGEFVADVTVPTVNTLNLYGADGWPTEPGRIYFGGDDGGIYKDFQVTVSSTPVVYGDLNNNGTITSADWMILRTNLYADTSGSSHQQAYFLGDLTADLAINHSDFFAFKTLYDNVNGAGSFVEMLTSVPEPITLALVVPPALMIVLFRRRAAHCINGN
jgi:hypothetical protein